LPTGYLEAFHQAQMEEAKAIKNHLSKYAPAGDKSNTSPYRVPLPSRHIYDYHVRELFESIKAMQGPTNNNNDGR
jgi:hypothetical protein